MTQTRRNKWPIEETTWPRPEEASRALLFRPIRIGPIEARTRTWIPAMVPWRCTEEGFVTPEILDWYGRFAAGLPGVLVVEATGIRDVPSGPLMRAGHERFLPGLKDLAEHVRERSAGQTKLFIQLIDFLNIRRRPEKSKFVRRFLKITEEHRAALAKLRPDLARDADEETLREALDELPEEKLSSVLTEREREDLERGYRERVNDTHLHHIAELPQVLPGLFADAAERAVAAGFDGIELHYAHAYTMASFLSRLNVREDGYGGSLEGRARMALEVYRAVRARVGEQVAIGCRMLGDEVIEGGSRVEDAAFYAEEFARAGMDFISISKGGKFEDAKQPKVGEAIYPYTGESGHECMPTVKIDEPGPFGRNLPLSAAIRKRLRDAGLRTPVVGAGGIGTFELAERALREESCDIAASARGVLADPDWFLKAERGQGADVRRCIYTNYCEGLDQKHKQVTCQLWDRDLDEPDEGRSDATMSSDGKRRLVAPPWKPEE